MSMSTSGFSLWFKNVVYTQALCFMRAIKPQPDFFPRSRDAKLVKVYMKQIFFFALFIRFVCI